MLNNNISSDILLNNLYNNNNDNNNNNNKRKITTIYHDNPKVLMPINPAISDFNTVKQEYHSLITDETIKNNYYVEDENNYWKTLLSNNFLQEKCYVLSKDRLIFKNIQTELTLSHHNKIIDFICETTHLENISYNTRILALSLFDQVLSLIDCKKKQTLLIASTCLFMAAKLEEIHPPYVEQLSFYAGKKFECNDLVKMELSLLSIFKYQIFIPTRYDFAQKFGMIANFKPKEFSFLMLLIELSFLDYSLHYYLSSQVAAAAIHLTIQVLRPQLKVIWNPLMISTTRCEENMIREIVIRIRYLHWNLETSSMKNIFQRYPSNQSYFISEVIAIPYNHLRFDSSLIPNNIIKQESYYLHDLSAKPITNHTIVSDIVVVDHSTNVVGVKLDTTFKNIVHYR